MIQTKLTNISTGQSILLSDELYPVDELNWSEVVANSQRTLNGSLVIQQGTRKKGKPLTLQATQDTGWLTREIVNQLMAECNKPEQYFWLEYFADDVVKKVKVVFDHTQTPIEAKPVKEFISPRLDDYFIVTLRFLEVL